MSYFSKKSVVVAQESSYGTNRVGFDVFVVYGSDDGGGYSQDKLKKIRHVVFLVDVR